MAHSRYPMFARWYPKAADRMESRGMAEQRRRLLAGLSGRVLEVGCGHGANFPHYPDAVTELIAVEPDESLADRARKRAAKLEREVTVIEGRAERLAFESGSFDAVVATLVLCSVEDPGRAIAEVFRVLKPGAELVLFEHVGAENRNLRAAQYFWDVVCWSHLVGGCHTSRDTGAKLRQAGFDTTALAPQRHPDLPFPMNRSPLLVGTARKPG